MIVPHPLQQMLDQAALIPVEPQRLYLMVTPRGGGRYHIEELPYRAGAFPPCEYRFGTALGDTIVVWSTNHFLTEKTAHEIAVRTGEAIGWYV